MKLHLNNTTERWLISRYTDNFIEIGEQQYTRSFILATDNGIIDKIELPDTACSLTRQHLHDIINIVDKPELFLLGADGVSLAHRRDWLAPFAKLGVALEIMSLSSACRTYNALHADGRTVVAIFLLSAS